ncbi:MAG: NYN domain-containing protein [Patescibacteria group bacterium]
MNHIEIKRFLSEFETKRERTIVIVDYGNVEKWKNNLKWDVGIRQLANLVRSFSFGNQFLRRFYYGADYGKNEKEIILVPWSKSVLDTAKYNRFEVLDKRVKYIHDSTNIHGFSKKCDLDVEMTIDLIKYKDSYDTIFLFSGDGDLMCAVKYLKDTCNKECYVFGARGHIGREVMDAKTNGYVLDILYAEDFEYRLNAQYQARS